MIAVVVKNASRVQTCPNEPANEAYSCTAATTTVTATAVRRVTS